MALLVLLITLGVVSGAGRPNIIVMNSDDTYLNYGEEWPDHPGFIGNGVPVVNINRLYKEGVRFERAYSSATMCAPARIALITGRFASRNLYSADQTAENYLNRSKVSVPYGKLNFDFDKSNNLQSILRDAGYKTGITGKSHIHGTPRWPEYQTGINEALDIGFTFAGGLYYSNFGGSDRSFSHNMEWVLENALQFMDDSIASGSPFFLNFNPTVCHSPGVSEAMGPDATYTVFDTPAGTLDVAPDTSRFCADCAMMARDDVWAAHPTDNGAGTYWIDQAMRVLLAYLTEKDELDNTIFVYSGDHGTAKGMVYEAGGRVPLFIRYPPKLTAGHVFFEKVSQLGLLPTLLDLAEVPMPADYDYDGVSFAPLITGEGKGPEYIYLEIYWDRAVVGDRYKLIYSGREADGMLNEKSDSYQEEFPNLLEQWQLYDLGEDYQANGEETTNLWNDPSVAEVQARMVAAYDRYTAHTDNWVGGSTPMDDWRDVVMGKYLDECVLTDTRWTGTPVARKAEDIETCYKKCIKNKMPEGRTCKAWTFVEGADRPCRLWGGNNKTKTKPGQVSGKRNCHPYDGHMPVNA